MATRGGKAKYGSARAWICDVVVVAAYGTGEQGGD